jgi:II/X family phage/plasmid replication protein
LVLDTVKLQSPYITEEVAQKVTSSLNTRVGFDNLRDVLMYEMVGGEVELSGSFDHRVRISINRKIAVWVPATDSQRGRTIMEDSPPYLEVEGSVHKAMVGHNVYGGPIEIRRACEWLIADLDRRLGAPLPYADWWEVRRLDWANVFDLGSAGAVGDYLWAMGQAAYPRRRAQNYGRNGVFFAGDTTALKFYAKGPEFRRHDYPRIRRSSTGGPLVAKEIAGIADTRMRVEVSIKAPVLDKAYDKLPIVRAIDEKWCADVWEREVQKVVREGRSDVEVVRTTADVRVRLRELYGTRGGNTLFATWVSLSTLGEVNTQANMSDRTFYRHRGQLVVAGCAWRSTDLQLVDAAPRFGSFVPTLVSPMRDVRIHPRVVECLARAA